MGPGNDCRSQPYTVVAAPFSPSPSPRSFNIISIRILIEQPPRHLKSRNGVIRIFILLRKANLLELLVKSLSGSERSGMVWDMGGRYHTVVWYDIETISFDFYGIV